MSSYTWYTSLAKPFFAPPAWVFGPVWTVLYVIIVATYGYVFYKAYCGAIPYWIAGLFLLNLVANLLFTPLQFGLESNLLAAIDITIILLSLVAALVAIYPYLPLVTYLNIPYLLWVCFATVLQFSITYLNW